MVRHVLEMCVLRPVKGTGSSQLHVSQAVRRRSQLRTLPFSLLSRLFEDHMPILRITLMPHPQDDIPITEVLGMMIIIMMLHALPPNIHQKTRPRFAWSSRDLLLD